MYLLDSSAIAVLLRRLRENAVGILEGKATLDLAGYELGNLIWKEHTLKKSTSFEEALNRAENLAEVLKTLKIEKLTSKTDFKDAMKLAATLKLTFYDASYLHIAKSRKLTLVTEDMKLHEKAKHVNIESLTVTQLLQKDKAEKSF